MSESIYITRHEFQELKKDIKYLADNLRALMANKKPSPWVTSAEAMELIGCKESKLKQLRREGKIQYRSTGGERGRNIRINRKSIEDYMLEHSTMLRIA